MKKIKLFVKIGIIKNLYLEFLGDYPDNPSESLSDAFHSIVDEHECQCFNCAATDICMFFSIESRISSREEKNRYFLSMLYLLQLNGHDFESKQCLSFDLMQLMCDLNLDPYTGLIENAEVTINFKGKSKTLNINIHPTPMSLYYEQHINAMKIKSDKYLIDTLIEIYDQIEILPEPYFYTTLYLHAAYNGNSQFQDGFDKISLSLEQLKNKIKLYQ